MASRDQLESLRAALEFVPSDIAGFGHKDIAAACAERGLPEPPSAAEHTKIQRAQASFSGVVDADLPQVAQAVLAIGGIDAAKRNQVQDALWAIGNFPPIPERTRRDIASALDSAEFIRDFDRLLTLVDRLFVLDDDPVSMILGLDRSLRQQLHQHVARNPGDWNTTELFERLGAFDASDRRFVLFLEGLAAANNIPDETAQRAIVAVVDPHLQHVGLELRETGERGGYPVFTVTSLRATRGRPKNVLFATTAKPDIRFSDALDNDIEVISGHDVVLAYDLPIGAGGLRWCDLQTWWKDLRNLDSDVQAKDTLYSRMLASLPPNTYDYTELHPQQALFRQYHTLFGPAVIDLPALLPEVWLHWDPKTVRERGKDALLHHRMDFLLLLPHQIRVVIEVDGQQHYANEGHADPVLYARTMRADRDLKLAGYEVFRIGAHDLRNEAAARETVDQFFHDLFRTYQVDSS